ncbi:hypothetical protein [Maridesulfovibrio ferrireducens]|nr:hypothetical protein [Maridesulfovibrio ferrireducens]
MNGDSNCAIEQLSLNIIGIVSGASVAAIAIVLNMLTNEKFALNAIKYNIEDKIYYNFVNSIKKDFIFIISSLFIIYMVSALPNSDIPFIRSPIEEISRKNYTIFITAFFTLSSFSAFYDISSSMFEVLRVFFEQIKTKQDKPK